MGGAPGAGWVGEWVSECACAYGDCSRPWRGWRGREWKGNRSEWLLRRLVREWVHGRAWEGGSPIDCEGKFCSARARMEMGVSE